VDRYLACQTEQKTYTYLHTTSNLEGDFKFWRSGPELCSACCAMQRAAWSHHAVSTHKQVGAAQVSVYVLPAVQVAHASCHVVQHHQPPVPAEVRHTLQTAAQHQLISLWCKPRNPL
jgi:hypothetical protein